MAPSISRSIWQAFSQQVHPGHRPTLVAAILLLGSVAACGELMDSDRELVPVYGLDVGPYVDGSDPTRGAAVSPNELSRLIGLVEDRTGWIRTYGSTQGLQLVPHEARSRGLKTAVGAWLGRDALANEEEIAALIELANEGLVDIAIVGSESLLRRDLTVDQLREYVGRVKEAVPADVLVTSAEDCAELLRYPELLTELDIVFFNFHPYFEGHDVTCAVSALDSCYSRLRAAVGTKPIFVSETGWPSCGETILRAVPSRGNARRYFENVVSWAEATEVPYFYFEAFDEPWKSLYEGPQGSCWGVWTADGKLKRGMASVFQGSRMADNWSSAAVIGGVGSPSIEFLSVPDFGTFEDLEGTVSHVRPSDFQVAVYIYVNGWWTKPYFDRPLTSITCDGQWRADVTTGGIDQRADQVPRLPPSLRGFEPPLLGGSRTFPPELEHAALASAEVERPPV